MIKKYKKFLIIHKFNFSIFERDWGLGYLYFKFKIIIKLTKFNLIIIN